MMAALLTGVNRAYPYAKGKIITAYLYTEGFPFGHHCQNFTLHKKTDTWADADPKWLL